MKAMVVDLRTELFEKFDLAERSRYRISNKTMVAMERQRRMIQKFSDARRAYDALHDDEEICQDGVTCTTDAQTGITTFDFDDGDADSDDDNTWMEETSEELELRIGKLVSNGQNTSVPAELLLDDVYSLNRELLSNFNRSSVEKQVLSEENFKAVVRSKIVYCCICRCCLSTHNSFLLVALSIFCLT